MLAAHPEIRRRRGARRERHVLRRRRHQRLQGDVLDAAAEAASGTASRCTTARFGAIMSRFEALPQTIVMVVEGAAYGGGLGLMCGGDVVLAAADAKFSISETTLGVPPAQIAPFVAAAHRRRAHAAALAHRAPVRRARGGAHRAGRSGLRRHGRAGRGAGAGARRHSRCAPEANAATKRLLLASRTMPREELLEQSADAFAACLRGAEGHEGVTAFLEKRKPKWMDWNESRGPGGGGDLERHRAGRAHRILRVAQSRAHAGARRHSGLPARAALHREIRHAGIFHALRGRQRRSAGRAGLSQPAEQSDAVDAARSADLSSATPRAASAA